MAHRSAAEDTPLLQWACYQLRVALHELRFGLLLVTLSLPSCDLLKGAAGGDDGGDNEPAVGTGAAAADDDGGAATALAEPLTRAKRRLRFIGKASEHLGWKLTSLSKMYSLAGAVEVPDWSPEGSGDIRTTRDDNLYTSWDCEASPDKTCAFGIHFPAPAIVTVVRINASPHGADKPNDFGRVRTIRVHTDEGWAEDNFVPEYEDLYLQLGEPVTTRNLTVEIIDLQRRSDSRVRIAEFDVFGPEGEARAPIDIEAAALYTRLGTPTWKRSGPERRLNGANIEYTDANGRPNRLIAGSAAFVSGDRFLLIEQLTQTKCKSHLGGYTMLDLKTHVRIPLGDLGGAPADVWPHKDGLGFAAGYVDENRTSVHAAVLDNGNYQRKKSSRASRDTYHELFAGWGVDEARLPRGDGRTVDDPPDQCNAATAEQFERLERARSAPAPASPKKKKRSKRSKQLGGPPDRWLACELGDGVIAMSSSGEPCGKRYEIAVLDAKGTLIAHTADNAKGSRLRVRRVAEHELMIEALSDDDVQVFSVHSDSIESLGMGTALAVSPPASCRDRCDTPFVNPRAP